jgi:5-methylcytosine-specific restriction endonuclease McrA
VRQRRRADETFREKQRVNARQWHAANRERAIAANRAWREANPGKNTEHYRRWRTENPEQAARKARIDRTTRRARETGVPSEPIDLLDIAERDGWCCHLCGDSVARIDASLDHLIPLSKGGPHLKTNVALAHIRCNKRRGTKPLLAVAFPN